MANIPEGGGVIFTPGGARVMDISSEYFLKILTPDQLKSGHQVKSSDKWPNLKKKFAESRALVTWPEVTRCQIFHKMCGTDVLRTIVNKFLGHLNRRTCAPSFSCYQQKTWAGPTEFVSKKYMPPGNARLRRHAVDVSLSPWPTDRQTEPMRGWLLASVGSSQGRLRRSLTAQMSDLRVSDLEHHEWDGVAETETAWRRQKRGGGAESVAFSAGQKCRVFSSRTEQDCVKHPPLERTQDTGEGAPLVLPWSQDKSCVSWRNRQDRTAKFFDVAIWEQSANGMLTVSQKL